MAYVYAATGYVQLGFFGGSALKDPKELLEDEGKYVRHIKVRAPATSTSAHSRICLDRLPASDEGAGRPGLPGERLLR